MLVANDIVDLGDVETHQGALHPRFDERVFTTEERALLRASPRSSALRWHLWASKESAFKLGRKLDPTCIFSPPLFAVSMSEHETTLRVDFFALRARIRIVRSGTCVHALAMLERDASGLALHRQRPTMVQMRANDPQAAVRQLATCSLARHFGVPPQDFEIVKRSRIPRLQRLGVPCDADLSLAHHGRFVGFACVKQCAGRVSLQWGGAEWLQS
jgi:hypothetical protein